MIFIIKSLKLSDAYMHDHTNLDHHWFRGGGY